MNNKRREQIEQVSIVVGNQLDSLQQLIEEEQNAFDNLPESFQEGEKGQKMEEVIDNLQSAVDALEEAIGALTEASE